MTLQLRESRLTPAATEAVADAGRLRRHGPLVVANLLAALRGGEQASTGSAVVARTLRELIGRGEHLQLDVAERGVEVGGLRLRVAAAEARELGDRLAACGVARVELARTTSRADLDAFAASCRTKDTVDGTFGGLRVTATFAIGPEAGEQPAVESAVSANDPSESVSAPSWMQLALRAYDRLVAVHGEARVRDRHGEPLPVRAAKHALREVVDVLCHDDSRLLAVLSVPDVRFAPGLAPVRIALLTTALGVRLTTPPKGLAELGVAALFRDYASAPAPDPYGVPRELPGLLRGASLGDAAARALQLAVELDQAEAGDFTPRSMFANVIAVCTEYDRRVSCSADGQPLVEQVFGTMLEQTGNAGVRRLILMLRQLLGCFPPGSIVRLASGALAVVVRSGAAAPDRPLVRTLLDAEGQPIDALVDVAQGERGGAEAVVATVAAEEVGLRGFEVLGLL